MSAVLLPDGKWHEIVVGSLDIDAYEYEGGDSEMLYRGGQDKELVPKGGARWLERDSYNEREVFCPITAIQAVAYEWAPLKDAKSR